MLIANSSNQTLAVKKYKELRRKQLVVRLTVTNNLMLTELPSRVRSYSFNPPSRLILLPMLKSYNTYILLDTNTDTQQYSTSITVSSLHLTSCGFLCRKATSSPLATFRQPSPMVLHFRDPRNTSEFRHLQFIFTVSGWITLLMEHLTVVNILSLSHILNNPWIKMPRMTPCCL